jgi:hypothetical protein
MKKRNDEELDFLKEIQNTSTEQELKDKLENTVYVLEKTINPQKEVDDIVFFMPKSKMLTTILDCQNEVYQNTFGEQRYSANIYEIKDVNKVLENIRKTNALENLDLLGETIIENGFKRNCIKNIEIEDIEKQKDLENIFDVLEKGFEFLKEKEIFTNFTISKENGEEKGYFSSMQGHKYGNIKIEIETNDIKELIDKTFKYFAIEDFNFKEVEIDDDEKLAIYDEYRNHFDFVISEEEIQEVINLDNNILSDELKNVDFNINDTKTKNDISKIELKYSNINDNFNKLLTIKSDDKTIIKEVSLPNEEIENDYISKLLTDRDIGKEFFKNHISETKENQLKVEYVLEEITNGLRGIANKENLFYDLEITKEDYQKLEYNLTVKNSENEIEKEIKSENLSNFTKEVFSFIENKGEKISSDFYFGETKYIITNLDDLKDTEKSRKFSIKIYNTNLGNDLTEIRVPLSDDKDYILKDFTSETYTNINIKNLVKDILTKNYYLEDFDLKGENVYQNIEKTEKKLASIKNKEMKELEEVSWKEFEDNIIATGFENGLKLKTFNITNQKVKENILGIISEIFEEKTTDEKINLLEKNAEELGLTTNEQGRIKEFLENKYGDNSRNEYENFGSTDIEEIYQDNAINFYHQKHFSVIENTMNEINEVFSKGNLLKDKEIFEEFSELQSKKIEKSTGILEKEENLLNLVFVTDIRNQEKYLSNYKNEESRNEKYFKENFDLEKFNKKLEEIGYHKISDDKIMKLANNIKLEKCDIILEKDKKNIKEEEIEKNTEKEIGY